ncbi:DUF5703 domain-containing protein [Terrimonas pollutisoli]|uniref:DUF5703 domain-containing protein n=1 Tax=Terrimonas pollutisoli TaxID=3034147 RepID=UPI0023ED943D|nr:DUF5703 domain-containing protein [Terrimonas sp. H1YJ31]
MMYRVILILFFLSIVVCEVRAQEPDYNVIWTTQSNNASESMPCGGGDIGMNVWVEKGELFIYVARSGSFNEDNALMKAGRLRIKLFPNPFDGKIFRQELNLKEGYVTVKGENNGVKANIKIWADVFRPVAHIDISASKKITVEAAYESWRYQDRVIKSRENFGNSWKWAGLKNHVYKKDSIAFTGNEVVFYHHNDAATIFDVTVKQQGLDSVKSQLYNPLKNLAFGGSLGGSNFSPAGTSEGIYVNTDFKGWKLKSSRAAKQHSLQLILHTAQVNDISSWKGGLDSLQKKAISDRKAFSKTQQWWRQFWNRSFIWINKFSPSSREWEVGRNFQLFRYMLACNAHGQWPTKFNGGLLTVDPVFTDTAHQLTPDYRNWGGGLHTAQNQRLVYFPMIKNGDWDMLQPQLDFYLRLLKNAELRSKVYWNHGGACFTEQMENYGLPNYAEYGTKRPADFDKGVEYNAWLEYEWDTVLEFCLMMLEENLYTGKDISDKIPFIEICLRFFDEHYQWLAKQRGNKALDGNGKLVLYPGSGAETFKMAYNSTSTISALNIIIIRLINLIEIDLHKGPHGSLSSKKIDSVNLDKSNFLRGLLMRIPHISFQSFNGLTSIAPAKTWERINNTESPQLYPVYPWGIYGIGKPGLDTALNTWSYDTNVVKFRSHIGWKQDNIWAARLGLTEEAWRLTSLKLQNSGRRFPAFWGPGFDWVPDHNWGGSGMIGLQEMLLQVDDRKILLFPAWPKDKDVHFKLHAPYKTTVEAELKDGKITSMKILPAERAKDVEIMLPK